MICDIMSIYLLSVQYIDIDYSLRLILKLSLPTKRKFGCIIIYSIILFIHDFLIFSFNYMNDRRKILYIDIDMSMRVVYVKNNKWDYFYLIIVIDTTIKCVLFLACVMGFLLVYFRDCMRTHTYEHIYTLEDQYFGYSICFKI